MKKTIPDLFEESVKQFKNNVLVWEKPAGSKKYEGLTYEQIHHDVYNFSIGLMELGLKKGDRVALLAEGRSEWLISELACLYLGVIDVPLSVKLNEPDELKFRIQHSGCSYIITSARQLDKVRDILNELAEIKSVIVMGTEQETGLNENEIRYEQVLESGKDKRDARLEEFNTIWQSIENNDIANISYTSGTTADPKGIMLSHRNYTANVEQANTLIKVPEWYSSLLILPWDHSFAHTVGLYTLIQNGASLGVVELGKTMMETLKNIPKNIKEVKPTFLLSVPALAKNFRKNIEKGIAEKGPKVEKLFQKALQTAYKYNGIGWDKGKGTRVFLKPMLWLYDKILFSKIREGFGGRLEFFIGGGALLDIDLQKFFYAIGMPMYQGYGLSEAAPIISSNAPHRHKMGSSGFLVKNLELKICDDEGNELPQGEKGEIVVKGENVMLGYWKNEKATAETLKDGWLYTGDMGYMDEDGFLYVLGRFKSLLIGNDGEKFSPEGIEEAIVEQSPFIEQCMLYNNQNAYTVGLIVPDKSYIKKWAKEQSIDLKSESGQKKLLETIQHEIDEYFKGGKYETMFPHRWLPAAIAVLDEAFTEENKLMNSTMKVVRGKVTEYHKERLDALYAPEGKNIINKLNMASVAKLA
jgi:long-chain acyl-CoA synthetase